MGYLDNKNLNNVNKKLHAFFHKKKHVPQANSNVNLKQNDANSNNVSNNSSSDTSVHYAVNLPVQQKEVLYRGDTRDYKTIFQEGFKRRNSINPIYTSRSSRIAQNYGNGSYYKIKLPKNHHLRMSDTGGDLQAVVFSDDIPPEYIKSRITSNTFGLFRHHNPNYSPNADFKPKVEAKTRPSSP